MSLLMGIDAFSYELIQSLKALNNLIQHGLPALQIDSTKMHKYKKPEPHVQTPVQFAPIKNRKASRL